MPLIGNDRLLYDEVAPEIESRIQQRLDRLIAKPRKIDAGYIQGARDALSILTEAADRLAKT